MKTQTHTHPCTNCGKPVVCDGTWERNHDGIPEVICGVYHLPSGALQVMECERCDGDGYDH